MVKKHRLNVRLDDDGWAWLHELARETGLDLAEGVRFAVKRTRDAVVSARRAGSAHTP